MKCKSTQRCRFLEQELRVTRPRVQTQRDTSFSQFLPQKLTLLSTCECFLFQELVYNEGLTD